MKIKIDRILAHFLEHWGLKGLSIHILRREKRIKINNYNSKSSYTICTRSSNIHKTLALSLKLVNINC